MVLLGKFLREGQHCIRWPIDQHNNTYLMKVSFTDAAGAVVENVFSGEQEFIKNEEEVVVILM